MRANVNSERLEKSNEGSKSGKRDWLKQGSASNKSKNPTLEDFMINRRANASPHPDNNA